jgi:predicted RNA-binding protein
MSLTEYDKLGELHKIRMERAMIDFQVRLAAQSNLREWVHMMQNGELKTNDVIRAEVNDDGTVNLYDFTLPSKGGMKRLDMPQEDVEPWIMESISMLRIVETNDLVPELGFKISDTLYYILNREGEMR